MKGFWLEAPLEFAFMWYTLHRTKEAGREPPSFPEIQLQQKQITDRKYEKGFQFISSLLINNV